MSQPQATLSSQTIKTGSQGKAILTFLFSKFLRILTFQKLSLQTI
jgi:hypothetical protein